MSSSEVQRTLVKSPPELWAELGDPAALARHLGGLGDIRITRIDPEQSVEWETEDASGTVLIKPSGWGTNVTLTVTRKTPEPTATEGVPATGAEEAHAEPAAEADHAGEDEPVAEADHAGEDGPALGADPTVEDEPPLVAWRALHAESTAGAEGPAQAQSAVPAYHADQAEPLAEAQPEMAPAQDRDTDRGLVPRRGFFARLFGRRPKIEAVEPEPPEVAVVAVWQPEALDGTPATEPQPEPREVIVAEEPRSEPLAVAEEPRSEPLAPVADGNAATELDGPRESAGESRDDSSSKSAAAPETAEQAASAEVTEVLTAVLDRLGAAHHRPFSRG